jgi:chorismate dehydratase
MIRIGCVSYLNTTPLVWGLDRAADLQLLYAVPARLLGMIQSGECDVALLPVIDYQRASDFVLVPGSCIGADGHVHTVRLFSRVPIGQIGRLYADVESHTSIGLCRILLKHVYGIEPEFVQDTESRGCVDAQLLIGDKVVAAAPADHGYQLDLAEAWKRWTGLPFVFAAWMAREGTDLGDLPQRLEQAMRNGLEDVDAIVAREAAVRGWPADIAREYLLRLLRLEIDLSAGSPQRQAMERFHRLAHEEGVTNQCRPIRVYRR